jgi:PhnB protein
MAKVKAIPEGYSTITPHLVCKDAAKAIEFYAKAFGAVERYRMPGPGGKVMHAEIQIGNSIVMLADEFPEQGARSPQSIGGTPVVLMIYTEDVDAAFQRATDAGAKAIMPPADMFWGDRYGKLSDPFGHEWAIATHREDVTPEEMARRMAAFGKSAGA